MTDFPKKGLTKENKMTIDDDTSKVITGLIKPHFFKPGLFASLAYIDDKNTMKWILVKFLKETMEFLSASDEARKTKRGEIVEKWIDINLNLSGEYDRSGT